MNSSAGMSKRCCCRNFGRYYAFNHEQCAILHTNRSSCSGNTLHDLVPAYVNKPG